MSFFCAPHVVLARLSFVLHRRVDSVVWMLRVLISWGDQDGWHHDSMTHMAVGGIGWVALTFSML